MADQFVVLIKCLPLLLVFTLFSVTASGQTPVTAPPDAVKLDSLAKLSQRFLNANQIDSLYALMGETFKKQISPEKMKDVAGQISGQLGKWTALESRGVKDGIARYKATFAIAPLDFYISQDKQGKIETFLFKPLTE